VIRKRADSIRIAESTQNYLYQCAVIFLRRIGVGLYSLCDNPLCRILAFGYRLAGLAIDPPPGGCVAGELALGQPLCSSSPAVDAPQRCCGLGQSRPHGFQDRGYSIDELHGLLRFAD
jgi:hypothetical protein